MKINQTYISLVPPFPTLQKHLSSLCTNQTLHLSVTIISDLSSEKQVTSVHVFNQRAFQKQSPSSLDLIARGSSMLLFNLGYITVIHCIQC